MNVKILSINTFNLFIIVVKIIRDLCKAVNKIVGYSDLTACSLAKMCRNLKRSSRMDQTKRRYTYTRLRRGK